MLTNKSSIEEHIIQFDYQCYNGCKYNNIIMNKRNIKGIKLYKGFIFSHLDK